MHMAFEVQYSVLIHRLREYADDEGGTVRLSKLNDDHDR